MSERYFRIVEKRGGTFINAISLISLSCSTVIMPILTTTSFKIGC
jgi:hypothetical protein